MALSDAEIGMFSINLKKTITGFFLEKKQAGEPGYNFEMNDSTLATMLLTSPPESLDDKSPDGYAALPVEDKHSVIERALHALTPGTGLTFDEPKNGLWVRVSLAHEGRTPLSQVEDYRWIRLSSIDQVIPKVALGSGQDSRGWGWNLLVKTNGGDTYYASDRTYRGELIQYPQNVLISAINSAVKAEIQPDALPKRA
ncbi:MULTISPECIES: hypothetical protein [Pseudomonas]|uniref:Uncharacterized protein n=1 Tax=Pseudomonas helleri TaxID=1608996 RepID=A0A7X1XK62_9PSED|nr:MULTISPECIES: hypothetical protein [Pseudomonas]MBK3456705.1 hypothetical protein [Pseudomonas sp. MF6754]MDB1111875.1 hypothetical protein [Pseudomonas extremaustralis]MQT74797.1 hypothetical protein [Pseudomonas helleri]MQT92649.1 hypothetical protein [Pseudomonas helleri]